MSRLSYLQDILSSVFERGRIFRSQDDDRDIEKLCDAILSERGEVSGGKIAASILAKFEGLASEEKKAFFLHLLKNFDLDADTIIDAANAYKESGSAKDFVRINKASEPRRRELLRRINQTPGATERLVRMREDLLGFVREEPDLKSVDADFEYLFSSWFNRGFLVLRPIDWTSPANILEKIIQYEAVHTINDWDDLRRRLQPEDRQCFAFFHPVMPEEPLIFVEVALTKEVPGSVNALLAEDRDSVSRSVFNTAVFYSISNCQKGLKGVTFGNFLIKQVVNDLAGEFPGLKNFVTLSPVPGFSGWLQKFGETSKNKTLKSVLPLLASEREVLPLEEIGEHKQELIGLLAQYLVEEKRSDGFPVDPVARFHLGNGASLMRLNWQADVSPNGFANSLSMMVNYKYDLATVEENHETYVREKVVHTTREIQQLASKNLERV